MYSKFSQTSMIKLSKNILAKIRCVLFIFLRPLKLGGRKAALVMK